MKTILLVLIRGYKAVISPLIGPACRFTPSCADYATQAIKQHGAFHGSKLALKRIARCHPWGGHGYDPLPEKLPEKTDLS